MQAILEVLEKEIAVINQSRQQRWSLKCCLQSMLPDSHQSMLPDSHQSVLPDSLQSYIPITLPTNGLLSDVMVCSRCGCRRQIRNTPFSALILPITSGFRPPSDEA